MLMQLLEVSILRWWGRIGIEFESSFWNSCIQDIFVVTAGGWGMRLTWILGGMEVSFLSSTKVIMEKVEGNRRERSMMGKET